MDFKENTKPIYLQIADHICDDVMAGTYAPETRLPSVREYASMVQVNANTVMRSYMHLADKGIIYNKRGIGFFTSAGAQQRVQELRKETFFNNEARYFFSRLRNMGVTPDTLLQLYSEFLQTTPTISQES